MNNNKINIFGYVFYNNIYSIYHKNYNLNTKIINEPNTLKLTIGGNNFIRKIFFTSQGCFFYTHGYGYFGQTRYINIKKFGTS